MLPRVIEVARGPRLMKQKSTLARPFTDADFDGLLRTVESNAKAIGKLERSTRRLDKTENNRGLEMERRV